MGAQHCLAASAAVGGDTDGAAAQRPAKLLQRDVVKELALLVADHDLGHGQQVTVQFAAALLDDVGARDKARHADVAAEILIFDLVHRDLYLRILLHQRIGAFPDQRPGQRAGNHIHTVGQH